MPIHDFRCNACGEPFELLVLSSTVPACPHCGATQVEKLYSAPSAPARSPGIIAGARKQAAREGHFSNYKSSERPSSK